MGPSYRLAGTSVLVEESLQGMWALPVPAAGWDARSVVGNNSSVDPPLDPLPLHGEVNFCGPGLSRVLNPCLANPLVRAGLAVVSFQHCCDVGRTHGVVMTEVVDQHLARPC